MDTSVALRVFGLGNITYVIYRQEFLVVVILGSTLNYRRKPSMSAITGRAVRGKRTVAGTWNGT